MGYPQLIPECAKALAENRCFGCQALENPYFIGNKDCKYSKIPTAEESIARIYKNLGVDRNVRNYR